MKNKKIREIIKFAIDNEIESYDFYKNAAQKIEDDQLKEVFNSLAKEEKMHEKYLIEFLESDSNKIVLNEFTDYDIAETLDTPELSVDMSFSDAIKLAIKKEEEAMDMYQSLAKDSNDNEAKNLFIGLREMEQMHKAKLEEIYMEVGYAEVW